MIELALVVATIALGLALAAVVAQFAAIPVPARPPHQRRHRHRWTEWSDLRTTHVRDVRHCEVCNKRQIRMP